jgi:hypothetical protein
MSPTDLSTSTAIVANSDCLSTTIDDESVILHTEHGKYYGFNEVGTHIWQTVQEPHTIDEVCSDIVSVYDVDEEQCLTDVRELVAELIELDLVHTAKE